jgi:hypothetical protein
VPGVDVTSVFGVYAATSSAHGAPSTVRDDVMLCAGICLEGLRKTTKNLNQDSPNQIRTQNLTNTNIVSLVGVTINGFWIG